MRCIKIFSTANNIICNIILNTNILENLLNVKNIRILGQVLLNKERKITKHIAFWMVIVFFISTLIPSISAIDESVSSESEIKINNPSYETIDSGFSEHNVIISPPRFYIAAKELEEFHDSNGIPTIVINTTWIDENYQKIPAPTYAGYGNRIIPRLFIRNYDQNLATKIIDFLRDESFHPNLEYVTLLGNGQYVPPSYYIHSRGRMTTKILFLLSLPYIYNNIVATDFFYTSPDYDLYPDYKVGRLPVSNVQDAIDVVHKIITWQENVDEQWFRNIYVAGDQPNLPEEMNLRGCYAGEMIAVDSINRNYFEYMNITKLFWTEQCFDKVSILNALDEGNAGFMYMMAHGFVDRWGTYNEPDPYVYASDLLSLEKNINIPVIVSVACMSGAYDTHLSCTYNLPRGTTSFGESVLLSKGAGIAYVGTTRATLGSPLLYLNQGEVVITKERGIAGMLTYFFEAYHQGTTTLGDLMNAAIIKYVGLNQFPTPPEKDNDFIVLASFVLLGDPALELPNVNHEPKFEPPYEQPKISAINPIGFTTEEYSRPWYYTGTEITLHIQTDSPQVNLKRIDINQDLVVERKVFYPEENEFLYTFTTNIATEHLIRAESLDGKESWFYLTTINP